MGGGTTLDKQRSYVLFKNLFISLIFFLCSVITFSEVPHSYVTENPKKEVQKVETFKQREKAELNLSVTKLKTKELEGKLVNGKLIFDITDKKDIQEGNILVTQGTPYKPNNARVRSANPIQILESIKEVNKLEVTGENLQDVYVNVLDSKGQLVGIYKNSDLGPITPYAPYQASKHINLEMDDRVLDKWLDGRDPYNESWGWSGTKVGENVVEGAKVTRAYYDDAHTKTNCTYSIPQAWSGHGYSFDPSAVIYNSSVEFNYNGWSRSFDIGNGKTIVNYKDLSLELNREEGYIHFKFLKVPQENVNFTVHFYIYGYRNLEGIGRDGEHHHNYYINFKVLTLKGNSTLTFAEYYPVNEFVQFTANPTIQNALPLALDNSVKDVTLETTGKGLVSMQQGDKLTIDGYEVVIGAGGNIGPQKLTIGNVKYTYEVKNGKFRIALNEWGVLEPNRIIPIKIVRNENGKEKSLAEHNLTIKAPRRVEGTSNVKLNQDYSIRNTIRFNGISLQGAGALGLENPIPLGVSLTSTAGQGIPFMKEGDRLEISDGLTTRSTYSTRGVKAFTIGPNGTLGKQQLKLNNGELTVFVEGGKLRVGVNNWLVNNTINSNVRLVRGTNEIMNHSLEIQVPNAPFNVKKNGLLDFGNVTAGSKRTAETDIVLEMLKDVSDVKFSLKDPQPILENLGTGDSLKVNRIEYLVSKQGKRDYKVKLKGNLTIPEATKSGLYTGSTVLELKIK